MTHPGGGLGSGLGGGLGGGAVRLGRPSGASGPAAADGTTAVDQVTYRSVIGRFATGIAVATTRLDGHDHAMTVNTLTSVSLDPLLMLVCVERTARFHDAVLAAGAWGVSLLRAADQDASQWFATRGRPLTDQLAGFRLARGTTGVALLADALAHLECRTTAVHDGGDHSIVVGAVVAASRSDTTAGPLVYYEGRYVRVGVG